MPVIATKDYESIKWEALEKYRLKQKQILKEMLTEISKDKSYWLTPDEIKIMKKVPEDFLPICYCISFENAFNEKENKSIKIRAVNFGHLDITSGLNSNSIVIDGAGSGAFGFRAPYSKISKLSKYGESMVKSLKPLPPNHWSKIVKLEAEKEDLYCELKKGVGVKTIKRLLELFPGIELLAPISIQKIKSKTTNKNNAMVVVTDLTRFKAIA